MGRFFQIIGRIRQITRIATGRSILELERLKKVYGKGTWRKCKGIATIRLADGTLRTAELHWYELQGVGKKEIKIKRLL